jgi:hypothetical protein
MVLHEIVGRIRDMRARCLCLRECMYAPMGTCPCASELAWHVMSSPPTPFVNP